MTAATVDEYVLENIAEDNPIRAEIFLPFTIARLREAETAREAELSVQLKDTGDDGERQRRGKPSFLLTAMRRQYNE